MKLILLLSTLLLSFSTFATEVNGKLFYTMPSGELVKRTVTLEVPARGQGEVVLSGNSFEWRTTNFWSDNVNGEDIFYAVFKTEFKEFKSTIALKGTYIKGTNKILYFGTMYKKSGHHEVEGDISDFKFSGGFKFAYKR